MVIKLEIERGVEVLRVFFIFKFVPRAFFHSSPLLVSLAFSQRAPEMDR